MHGVYRARRRAGFGLAGVLVVGSGIAAEHIVERVVEDRSFGVKTIGVLCEESVAELDEQGFTHLARYRIGSPELAEITLRRYRSIGHVLLFPTSHDEAFLLDLVRQLDHLPFHALMVPPVSSRVWAPLRRRADDLWGFPVVPIPKAAYLRQIWFLKRVIDVTVASVALLLLSPVLVAVAVAVYLDGGPGVIFHQQRIGLDGKRFTVFKFRSLRPQTAEEAQTTWNIAQDDRLTPVGKFLRTYSLDEFPQLWNVVRGDMSLVGPGPERPHFVERFNDTIFDYPHRHRVRPGLTGLAAAKGMRGTPRSPSG